VPGTSAVLRLECPEGEDLTMTDAPPPTPPTPAAESPSGPRPGEKIREWLLVAIFSIITLGIYYLYWTYQVFRELKEHTGQGIGPVIGLVIGIVFNPVNWFVLPSEIGNMYAAAGKEKPVSGATGFWNFIPLVGFFIWVWKVQGALNRAWEGAV
jgi:Domain of unknown function (DUF4234)